MAVELTHEHYVKGRRLGVLARLVSDVLPSEASVLDVGAGDGRLSRLVMDSRPGVSITGLDPLVRPDTAIPVHAFDGHRLPCESKSVDFVMFVDVLHHAESPLALLREAVRVVRKGIVIKDHCLQGFAARPTLTFMDRVGNRRFGVDLPYNYWTQRQWDEAFETLRVSKELWQTRLGIYPWWADWVFGRRLHFLARLAV